MQTVISFNNCLPDLFVFQCPRCAQMFNAVFQGSTEVSGRRCPGCRQPLHLIFVPDPDGPPGDEEQNALLFHRTKPDSCPQCGSSKIADILYGYPHFGEELDRDIAAGKIVLGGCIHYEGASPEWRCTMCGFDFYPA